MLMLCIGGFFIWWGTQWDSNKAALTRQRQSNQQPSGLLVSLRVPSPRNVYRGRTLSGGVCPVGVEPTFFLLYTKACAGLFSEQ